MDTTKPTSRYEIRVKFEQEYADQPMLAIVFDELANIAYNVKKAQDDLNHIVKDNAESIANGRDPFYKRSSVDNAADFERAYAQYEVVERLFLSACYHAGIEREEFAEFVSIARQGR